MRINVIPVQYLTDVHLQAEFREIIMSIHYYKRSKKKGIDPKSISSVYTLNQGHAKMWYNKFGYIKNRYQDLLFEMKRRKYKTESIEAKFNFLFNEIIPVNIRNDYVVTHEDILVNVERILSKLHHKIYVEGQLDFYKILGESYPFKSWMIYYSNVLKIDIEVLQKLNYRS